MQTTTSSMSFKTRQDCIHADHNQFNELQGETRLYPCRPQPVQWASRQDKTVSMQTTTSSMSFKTRQDCIHANHNQFNELQDETRLYPCRPQPVQWASRRDKTVSMQTTTSSMSFKTRQDCIHADHNQSNELQDETRLYPCRPQPVKWASRRDKTVSMQTTTSSMSFKTRQDCIHADHNQFNELQDETRLYPCRPQPVQWASRRDKTVSMQTTTSQMSFKTRQDCIHADHNQSNELQDETRLYPCRPQPVQWAFVVILICAMIEVQIKKRLPNTYALYGTVLFIYYIYIYIHTLMYMAIWLKVIQFISIFWIIYSKQHVPTWMFICCWNGSACAVTGPIASCVGFLQWLLAI